MQKLTSTWKMYVAIVPWIICLTDHISAIWLVFVWFTGIFDTRQRHQIKNGYKIGMKNSLYYNLVFSIVRNSLNVSKSMYAWIHEAIVAEPYRANTTWQGSELFVCHVCRRATRHRGAVMESRSQSLKKRPASSAVAYSEDRGLPYWLPAGWT